MAKTFHLGDCLNACNECYKNYHSGISGVCQLCYTDTDKEKS